MKQDIGELNPKASELTKLPCNTNKTGKHNL